MDGWRGSARARVGGRPPRRRPDGRPDLAPCGRGGILTSSRDAVVDAR